MEHTRRWQGSTFGSAWMHRSLIWLLRWIDDVRVFYALAAIFVVPFCLVLLPSGRISYRFFRERWGRGRGSALWQAYLNHCLFAQVVIDRFAMYAGVQFQITIEGYESFLTLAKQPEGFVQLSAHMGNYEIAGYTLTAQHKPFNTLVFAGEKNSIMAERNKLFEETNIRMIPLSADMNHLFEIDKALRQGETVSIPADRLLGSTKHLVLPFLGADAEWPQGPFSVATARGVSVLAVNVMKTSTKSYTIYVSPLGYDREAPRREQIHQLATGYIAELERLLRLYPTQWYNYYDFWIKP